MNAIGKEVEGAAEKLRFAYGNFSLGRVLVAVSSESVAAILIGDGPDALRRELADAFPRAELVPDEAGLAPIVERVSAYLEAPRGELGLPLALRGSAVERAVWEALHDVPYGRTVSYGEIARALPLPATAQEVGAAAPPTCSRSPSPATGWSRRTGRSRAIAGAYSASAG